MTVPFLKGIFWSFLVFQATAEIPLVHSSTKKKHRTKGITNFVDSFQRDDRNLQGPGGPGDADDPCTSENARLIAYGLDFLTPSYFSQCAASLQIDTDNMKLHIESLNEIFRQYHCFYDIAKDPVASSPASFQPEFGNTIYVEGGGKVDIDAGLNAILDDIDVNGASMATFWKINTVFNQLVDGHVAMPSVEQDFYSNTLVIFPERYIGVDASFPESIFSLDENGELQMTVITFVAGDSEIDIREVETLNGLNVSAFVTYLANSPELNLPYQDLGARVNILIQNNLFFFGLLGSGTPSDLLPDTFVVTYKDGTSETYYFAVLPSDPFFSWLVASSNPGQQGTLFVDRATAEAFINQPGEQYDAYQRATGRIDALTRTRGKPSPKVEYENLGSTFGRASSRQFQESIFNVTIPDIQGAVAGGVGIVDDYVVMKLSTFLIDPNSAIELWLNAVAAAQENGIKKLLVDISGNGGGLVVSGYALLFLMFPDVGLEWYTDQWDINYNEPMQEFLEALLPLAESILSALDELPLQAFLERLEALTSSLEIFQIAAEGIYEICNDAVNPFDPLGNIAQCIQAENLLLNVTSFVESPDLFTYANVALSLLDTILEYNPWSVVLEQAEEDTIFDLWKAGPQTSIRGGVESNVTARFNLIGSGLEEIYDVLTSLRANFTFLDHSFDEYLFVSDGVSGSMGAIFPFMSSTLYKNRDQSNAKAKVTLVAYGGTGNADDFTVASFPASVQGVHLEDPIIGDAALQMLAALLPLNTTGIEGALEQAMEYSDSIALPPYFADTLPIMPVVSFYDRFMDPGALPLQYVKTPVDEYIPTIYTRVSFTDPSELPSLYEAASKFFSDPVPTPAPVTPAPVTPAPVTPAPVTPAPTPAPATPTPVTTPAPVTPAPATPAPVVETTDSPTNAPVATTATNPPTAGTTDSPTAGSGVASSVSGFWSCVVTAVVTCLVAASIL